mgnify:CR=1 FL=1
MYNEERIAGYWGGRPGELAGRWTKFAAVSGEPGWGRAVCVGGGEGGVLGGAGVNGGGGPCVYVYVCVGGGREGGIDMRACVAPWRSACEGLCSVSTLGVTESPPPPPPPPHPHPPNHPLSLPSPPPLIAQPPG